MKNLALLLTTVLVCGSSVSAENSDRFRSSEGTECAKRFETGKEVTTGLRVKENVPEVYIEFTFELGKGKYEDSRIDCGNMMDLEEERMRLDNEKLRTELELLKRQLEDLNKMEESFDDW